MVTVEPGSGFEFENEIEKLREANILYLVAGDVERFYPMQREIDRWQVGDIIRPTGRISMDEFLRLMNRSDVIVNLRYPSAGEMSGTLIRALACGKPVIISRLKSLQEIPQDAVLRVRPEKEREEVFHALSRLIENEGLRRRLGAAARAGSSCSASKATSTGYVMIGPTAERFSMRPTTRPTT
jgi:glycosyltransferase involved in cell wall biosynthesis